MSERIFDGYGVMVWRDVELNDKGEVEKGHFVARVSYHPSTGNLYVTHSRGYSDKSNATQADYARTVRKYRQPARGYYVVANSMYTNIGE